MTRGNHMVLSSKYWCFMMIDCIMGYPKHVEDKLRKYNCHHFLPVLYDSNRFPLALGNTPYRLTPFCETFQCLTGKIDNNKKIIII